MNTQTVDPSTLDQAVNPALAELKDIIVPDPIGAWPWALGYWLVLIMLIAILIVTLGWLRKRAKYLAPKKAAKKLFTTLDRQAVNYASEVNSLLKRTALSYLDRNEIAKLDGDAWAVWLDNSLPVNKRERIGPLLAKRHRAIPLTVDEANELHELAHAWFSSKTKLAAPIKSHETKVISVMSTSITTKIPEEQC